MNFLTSISHTEKVTAIFAEKVRKGTFGVREVFILLRHCILAITAIFMLYWIFASDRYVSQATILLQNTETSGVQNFDLSSLMGTSGTANRADQLLLREYLLSVDILIKLDKRLSLRAHYSDSIRDFMSRMWFRDTSIELFYRHFLERMSVEFDDYSGVLRVRVEAYDQKMAKTITSMLVEEGERHMNSLSHELAQAQVDFLNKQVSIAYADVLKVSQILLDYQNKEGLASPLATAENISGIIAKLETKRTEMQTQLASLPANLVGNHAHKVMLRQALVAIEKQIVEEKARLVSTKGKPLNIRVVEQQRMEMDVSFKQDIYRTALVALEKGRMDASRTIKKMSVLQSPLLPEYATEPRRLYGALVTFCLALLIMGFFKLLELVVLDHID